MNNTRIRQNNKENSKHLPSVSKRDFVTVYISPVSYNNKSGVKKFKKNLAKLINNAPKAPDQKRTKFHGLKIKDNPNTTYNLKLIFGVIHNPNARKREPDLDNLVKSVVDVLEVYYDFDDRDIVSLKIFKHRLPPGTTEYVKYRLTYAFTHNTSKYDEMRASLINTPKAPS